MTKETEMNSDSNPKEKTSRIVKQIKKIREKKGATGVIKEPLIILVIFEIRGAYFALKGLDVSEIIPIKKINPVPTAPKHILGLVNIRGEIESVLEIGDFLGLPAQERNLNNRIMILEKDSIRAGILASSVLDVIDIKKSQIRDAGSTLYHDFKDWVAGELDYDNHTVTLLNSLNVLRKTIPN
jgi:purine-binding chemotaxis protein CheW